jgi:hypothetical protein
MKSKQVLKFDIIGEQIALTDTEEKHLVIILKKQSKVFAKPKIKPRQNLIKF